MTEEDLKQIRQIVDQAVEPLRAKVESLGINVESLRVGQDHAVESLQASQDRAVESLKLNQDRAVESLIGNISDLRNEINLRFDQTDRRLEAVTIHLDRIDTRLAALNLETSGMSKSLTAAERLDISITATQAGQQKAIDALYVQVAELKRRLDQPRQ